MSGLTCSRRSLLLRNPLGGVSPLTCSRRSLLLRNPLGRDSNSLCERGAEPALPVCRGFNLPNNAQQLRASTTTQREKLRTHCRVVRPTRRASAQSYAQCGYGNDKKFRSSLFKGLRVQGGALGATDTHYLTICFRRHWLRKGMGKPSKGCPM